MARDKNEVVIEPSYGLISVNLDELWRYRELLYFLTWRDIKVRYKQTALGAAWAVLQPLLTMILFSVLFGYFAGLPSEGVPYPVFTLTALVPWQLFSYALTQSSTSLVTDRNLITKVYFPRLAIPISSVLAGIIDFLIAFTLLLIVLIFLRIGISIRVIVLPFLVMLCISTALSVGLWLSALNVKYRDVRYTLPFLSMLWFYATPIAYSITIVPDQWRLLYSLNPMVGVVEGFRWALLGSDTFIGPILIVSMIVALIILVSGLIYFKRMEENFADII